MKKILKCMNFNVAVRFIGLISIVIFQSSLSLAEVPHLINFQGRLTDSTGKPYADGTYNIRFGIWKSGTSTDLADKLWGETQSVVVNRGVFSTMIGTSPGGIPTSVFDIKDTWLEMEVELPIGSGNYVRLPRQRLVTVPYAYRAEIADSVKGGAQLPGDLNIQGNLYMNLHNILDTNLIQTNEVRLINYGLGIILGSYPILLVDGQGYARLKHNWSGSVSADISNGDYYFFEVVRDGVGPAAKFYANGTKAGVFKHPLNPNESIEFYAIESPKIAFVDFGEGKLENGAYRVTFDNEFHLMISNTALPNIQLTPLGDCKGLYVSERTSSGFVVKELQEGKSNVSFSWKATGLRKEYEDMKKVKERKKAEELKIRKEMK